MEILATLKPFQGLNVDLYFLYCCLTDFQEFIRFYVILVGKQAYALVLAVFCAHNTKNNDFFQC